MATITIDIPSEHVQRVLDALADHWNYTDQSLPGETQAQFAKRQIIEFLKRVTLRYEADQAAESAEDTFVDPGLN